MSGSMGFCRPCGRAGTMLTMSTREEGRLRVLEQVLHGKLSQVQAAGLLAVSVRQMRRLQRRYEAQGGAGLAYQFRGQVSNRKLDAVLGTAHPAGLIPFGRTTMPSLVWRRRQRQSS